MRPSPRPSPLLAALLATVALLAACADSEPPPEGAAPPPSAEQPLPPLDHFLCYRAANLDNPELSEADLKDQFDGDEFRRFATLGPHRFCNPVKKSFAGSTTPIEHPDHHLTYYQGPGPDFAQPLRVEVTNQLAPNPQRLELSRVAGLMVPTQKVQPKEHGEPEGLDHFKCYDVAKAKPIGKPADLVDQIDTPYAQVVVGKPELLCNPTEKKHDGEHHPIGNPGAHLVCYRIARDVPPLLLAGVTQFGDVRLQAAALEWLCVPSTKQLLKARQRPEGQKGATKPGKKGGKKKKAAPGGKRADKPGR